MLQTTDEFWDDFLEENTAAEAAGNSFAEKMADLDKKITERIDQVEKNILNSMQPQLQEEAEQPDDTEEAPEENNEEEGE